MRTKAHHRISDKCRATPNPHPIRRVSIPSCPIPAHPDHSSCLPAARLLSRCRTRRARRASSSNSGGRKKQQQRATPPPSVTAPPTSLCLCLRPSAAVDETKPGGARGQERRARIRYRSLRPGLLRRAARNEMERSPVSGQRTGYGTCATAADGRQVCYASLVRRRCKGGGMRGTSAEQD